MKKNSKKRQESLAIVEKVGFIKTIVLLAACAGLVSCTVDTDVGNELEELLEGQKAILERVEKIEKSQKELLTSWQKRFSKRPSIDYNKVYDIKIGKSPVRGAEDAKVTLVEFSDFQCPYSQRAQPLIEKLLEAYPEDLRHVYKNLPLGFHKEALPAAKACLAADMQGKFWEMEELVFKNPKKLKDKDLKGYAKEIGLDVERFEKDYKSDEVDKRVQEDMAEAKKAQVTGTPTLFLNGKRVKNRSEEAMKEDIKSILEGKKKS
jgi:protein-disulfide isomerase